MDDAKSNVQSVEARLQRLAELEQRLQDITRLVSDWIWETDVDGKLSFVSGRVFEVLGYVPQELVGRPLLEFIQFDDHPRGEAPSFLRSFRDRSAIVIDRAGNGHPSVVGAVPRFDSQSGKFIGARGTVEDVSTKIAYERHLKDSEFRYRTLVDQSPFAIYVIVDGVIRFANTSAVKMFEAESMADLVGRPTEDITHPDDFGHLHALREEFSDIDAQREIDEIKRVSLTGRVFYTAASSSSIEWEGEPAVLVSCRDISEKILAEKALAESQSRIRDFAEASADQFWETDAEFTVTDISWVAGNAPQFSLDPMIGRKRWDHPMALDRHERKWIDLELDMKAQRHIRNFRFSIADEQGNPHFFHMNAKPVTDETGRFAGYRGTTSDITREVEAEERAHSVQNRFFSAIENFSEGFALWGSDGEFVYANSFFRHCHGDFDRVLQTGQTYREFADVLAKLGATRTAGSDVEKPEAGSDGLQGFRAEYEIFTGDKWTLLNGHRLDDGSTIVILTDFTEMRRQQEALLDSQLRLRMIADSIPAFIAHNDAEFRFTFANEYFRVLGLNPDEMIGKSFGEVFGDDLFENVRPYLKLAESGEIVNYENALPTPDGGRINTQVLLTPEIGEDGKFKGMFVMSLDVTDQKAAEAESERVRAGLNAAQRLAHVGSWDRNLVSDTMTWSDEMYRIHGLEPSSDPISVSKALSFIYEDDRDLMIQSSNDAIAAGQVKFSNEYRIVRADGARRLLRGDVEIVYEDDVPVTLRGTAQDITEQRSAENALERARLDAIRANRAKSDFLSSMSHELRTPMNAVLGYAQLLLQNKKDPISPRQRRQISQILNSGQHLLQLINDILDLSRIEAGRLEMELKPVQPRNVIGECLGLVQTAAENKKVTVHDLTQNRRLPQVLADEMRLKQSLLNLLSNAVKFNVTGGEIQIQSTITEDARLRLSVSDTGIGIEADKFHQVFEPFSRLDADNREIEGTGIGLSITRQLVDKMKGKIGFESEFGKGSTFWIDLIVADAEAGELARIGAESEAAREFQTFGEGREVTVLYVEDDLANLELMQEVVHHVSGLRLISAETGEAGLEVAREQRPDIIVIDINLPGIDGYQVLNMLRSDPDTAEIPAIALSAAAMAKDIERGTESGFFAYLTKPLIIDELLQSMNDALKAEFDFPAGRQVAE